jgi:hypothetical protein
MIMQLERWLGDFSRLALPLLARSAQIIQYEVIESRNKYLSKSCSDPLYIIL